MKTSNTQQQLTFIPQTHARTEHGGTLLLGKRRRARPLSIKRPIHLVLRSDFAYGSRNLLRHRPLIHHITKKAAARFKIRIYQIAIVSNHIHLLVKGHSRTSLQNFFRVIAGHIAQWILMSFPILAHEKPRSGGGAPGKGATSGNCAGSKCKSRELENKFWQTRIYSRLVSWGREFKRVKAYVIQNDEEARGLRRFGLGPKLALSSALKTSLRLKLSCPHSLADKTRVSC